MMKTLIALCFVSIFMLTNCKKDNIKYTGTLKIIFPASYSADYQNIDVSIYTMTNLDTVLFEGHPDQNGIYAKELLAGNYYSKVIVNTGNFKNSSFQIINGETTSLDY